MAMLDDHVLEVKLWNFGLLIKRRSLILGLAALLMLCLGYYVYAFVQNGQTWCVENRTDIGWS
jgi:hypothetical protein